MAIAALAKNARDVLSISSQQNVLFGGANLARIPVDTEVSTVDTGQKELCLRLHGCDSD
jgi:hypothetical protein